MDAEQGPAEDRATASNAYALGRLWRAIETATTHDDPAARGRAEQKALAWEAVLSGMATGTVAAGSRTPVADTPAWVTLEVVHGGFATGRYVAARPLDGAERSMLDGSPTAVAGSTDRMRLNRWLLTDEGLARLEQALREGSYVVEVPEHAALLVVAWLLSNGHEARALDLVAELYPLIDRLRFSPHLTDAPPARAAVVHLRSVGAVLDQLTEVDTPPPILAMNESLLVWQPLYDELVDIWLQTVEDDWPCVVWPADWSERRNRWLTDYRNASESHTACGDHLRPRSNFAILRSALEDCPLDSSRLSARDVGRVRMVLHRSIERRGAPGSEQLRELRARQAEWARRPTNKQVAAVIVDRLGRLPKDAGLADAAAVLEPVEVHDDLHDVPPALVTKVERAREAPVEELVAARIISSGEVLAAVLPQITSHVAAAPFADPILRDLYARTYAAFRRRRSLLLLNLEHQVQIEELPWVRAIESFRLASSEVRDQARRTLREVTLLTLTSFPQTVLPNPMVRELSMLARQADLDIPFVEEVATDIFMGTFTTKWQKAAALASSTMADTLYAGYYDLPPAAKWETERSGRSLKRPASLWAKPVADDFAAVCDKRAREAARGDGNFVARNGTVLEQSQILTTHNLAPLIERLDLRNDISRRALDLASTTLRWVVREQNTDHRTRRSKLQMVKNTAYAWRQAIFFLSFAPAEEQHRVVADLRSTMRTAPRDWQRRFEPALVGLEAVLRGDRFDPAGVAGTGRRFLGWSVGHHWMLPTDDPSPRR